MLLVGFSGILLLFTLIGLVMPSSVKISRGIAIHASDEKVRNRLTRLNEWPEWVPWLQSDKGILITVGTDTASPFLEWRQMEAGKKGILRIKSVQNAQLNHSLGLPGLNMAEGTIQWRKGANETIEVIWMLEYPLRWYPWERFEGIFMDAMIGALLQQTLEALKKTAEISFRS